MKKIIRLTESDLVKLVKRVINEQAPQHCLNKDLAFKVKQGTAKNLITGEVLTPKSQLFSLGEVTNKLKDFLQVDNGGIVMFRNGSDNYEIGPGMYNCQTLSSAKKTQKVQQLPTTGVQGIERGVKFPGQTSTPSK